MNTFEKISKGLVRLQKKQENEVEKYIKSHIEPAIKHLLTIAQKKLARHRIQFLAGMGTWTYSISNMRHDQHVSNFVCAFNTVPSGMYHDRYSVKLRSRFPELVEIDRICCSLLNIFNWIPGNINPDAPEKQSKEVVASNGGKQNG
jgi:hypothetical protein